MNKRKDVQMMERKDPASAVICTSKILETYAFREEKTLQRIVLSEGVEVIGAKAFFGCSNLEYISLPSTLTNVDMRAFDGCDRLRQIDYNGNRAKWRNQYEWERCVAGRQSSFFAFGNRTDAGQSHRPI